VFPFLSVIAGNLAVFFLLATLMYAFTKHTFGIERGKVLLSGGLVAMILLAASHILVN